jgi:GDP-4-dehydro-6-deoxy-D-mannose reductase
MTREGSVTPPVLITGVGGFAGRHLVAHLLAQGDGPLIGLARPDLVPSDMPPQLNVVAVELNDRACTEQAVRDANPAFVYHLAAQSSVADSHADPLGTLFNNIGGQVNLLEALAGLGTQPRVLVVGSNEEYGDVEPSESPVAETNELRPVSAYAVSKVAQDLLGYQYFKTHGLPIVRVRPFTHIGPGQEARFAVAAFARQIARIEAGLQPPTLSVGNLEAERDFTDVRDIVRGYRLALHHGQPGDVYNLGSERSVSIGSILERLLSLSTASITIETDPARLRPSETAPHWSDCARIRQQTAWRPLIPLKQTLADVLADWRQRVARLGQAA